MYLYIYIYIYTPHLLYPSVVRCLGCFHILAIVNNACNCKYMHWGACIFLNYGFLRVYAQ